jgi:hypothetical protein
MSSDPYLSPECGSLICVLGEMVSKNTISAEGRILSNCLWEKPVMNTLGFFLLEPRGSIIVVRQFLEIK